jgi:DNA helicase MCM9
LLSLIGGVSLGKDNENHELNMKVRG